MSRTPIGLAIIDKAALEDGILSLLQFKPFDVEPTQEDANVFITECMSDPEFSKTVTDMEASPICLPTIGLLCDMFDQMTNLTIDVQNLYTLQQKAKADMLNRAKPPAANPSGLILPGNAGITGTDYPSDIPVGAQLIFGDIQKQMMN